MTDTAPTRPTGLPDWLLPVAEGATTIRGEQITNFLPPDGAGKKRSAVLMLFGEGADGPDLLLTERSHTMRSHPGQVSFPGGGIDPGETAAQAALREGWEETGLESAGVDVIGFLPDLWLPPSDNVVTPVLGWWREECAVHARSEDEVHAVYRVPISELADPTHRIRVASPRTDWVMPGFLIGPDKNVILWGFTAGIVARFLGYIGWIEEVPDAPLVELPGYMLQGRERTQR